MARAPSPKKLHCPNARVTKSGYKRTHIAVKTEISVQKAYVQSTLCPLYIFITWLITVTTLGFSRLFDPFPIDRNFQVDETFTLEAQGLRWGRRGNCDRCVKPSTPRGVKEIINGRMKCGEFGHLTRFSVRKTGNGRGQTILCSIINF